MYLKLLTSNMGHVPVQEHYINIIDRFMLELVAYQGGHKEIVKKMCFQPSSVLWHSVLSCCGNGLVLNMPCNWRVKICVYHMPTM